MSACRRLTRAVAAAIADESPLRRGWLVEQVHAGVVWLASWPLSDGTPVIAVAVGDPADERSIEVWFTVDDATEAHATVDALVADSTVITYQHEGDTTL